MVDRIRARRLCLLGDSCFHDILLDHARGAAASDEHDAGTPINNDDDIRFDEFDDNQDPTNRIARPRQIYTGNTIRDYKSSL